MNRKYIIALLLLLPIACTSAVSVTKPPAHPAPPTYDIIIHRVYPNSPAKKANLKTGDRILKINGEPMTSLNELKNVLAKIPGREKFYITIERDGRMIELAIVAGRGMRHRYGFLFKPRDTEIAKHIKLSTLPDKLNPKLKNFTIPFQLLSMMNKSNRSPKKKVLFHLKELLISKGYLFTESYEKADFIAKVDFKKPKSKHTSSGKRKKLPFDALRVTFVENDRQSMLLAKTNSQPPLLKITGTLEEEKARFYGAKEYVFSVLDAMIENFPPYQGREKLAEDFMTTEKKRFNGQSSPAQDRHLGMGTGSY